MEWKLYKKRYDDFVLSLRQADLIAVVAARALSDFPKKLPADWLID